MDFEKLTQLFPNIKRVSHAIENHFIFSASGQLYAIPESEITPEQIQLIESITDSDNLHTPVEIEWLDFLQRRKQAPKSLKSYRFIMMKIHDGHVQPDNFRQSINMMLNKPLILIWQNQDEVVLIEEIFPNEDSIAFDELIDVMSEDLNISLRIFISDIYDELEDAPDIYEILTKVSQSIWNTSGKRIVHQQESLIRLLPTLFSQQDKRFFTESILKTSMEDRPLIHTIKTVIEHQGNVTSAAKELYMHRNSVQYRIDKFSEITNHDIKQFDHMLRVYLAILLLDT